MAHPSHAVYNLSSGVEWVNPIRQWCEVLKNAYPQFDYRVAAAGEEPNIWYTDTDRNLMDVGRIAQDLGFAPRFGMKEAYANYVDWLGGAAPRLIEAIGGQDEDSPLNPRVLFCGVQKNPRLGPGENRGGMEPCLEERDSLEIVELPRCRRIRDNA